MRIRFVSRRRFLASMGAGSAAMALGPAVGEGAAERLQQPDGAVSPALLEQLAQYADFPLPPDRAHQLSALLGGPLAALRQLRPAGYDNLEPASIFRVPPEG
jgi:hypothetical protein